MCQGMAPPPTARRRCDRPVTAGRSTALKGSAGATSARARPADRYQDNPSQGVSRFASQAGTQARLTVLLHRPQGGGLSPITLLSTTPCDRRARSASLHILPADSARGRSGGPPHEVACRTPCSVLSRRCCLGGAGGGSESVAASLVSATRGMLLWLRSAAAAGGLSGHSRPWAMAR